MVCADFLKAIIFREKRFVKDGSFTNFWFVELIHKSQSLNSSSEYIVDVLFESSNI